MIRETLHSSAPCATSTVASLRILIPAHDESERIGRTLAAYCEHFGNRAIITVIANACTDDTVETVRHLMHRYANLNILVINGRVGKGGAIRAGLKIGAEPYVGFADADGSTPAAEFQRLFDHCIVGGADGVVGSRWIRGAVVFPRQPFARRIASRAFNTIVRMLFGLPFADTQCGAKIFRREAVGEVLPALEIADFAFDIDLLFHLHRAGFRVAEVATHWADRATGTKVQLVGTSWTMFKAILRLRVQESVLWRLPFAEFLARDSIIPVKEGTRILALTRSTDRWSNECMSALEAAGVAVDRVDVRKTIALLWWYAFRSKRSYDAVVEVMDGPPALIPLFSAKRCFLIRTGATTGAHTTYWNMCKRAHRLTADAAGILVDTPMYGPQHLERPDAAAAAKYIIDQIGAGGVYRAAFHRQDDGWELRFNDVEPGYWNLKELQ